MKFSKNKYESRAQVRRGESASLPEHTLEPPPLGRTMYLNHYEINSIGLHYTNVAQYLRNLNILLYLSSTTGVAAHALG